VDAVGFVQNADAIIFDFRETGAASHTLMLSCSRTSSVSQLGSDISLFHRPALLRIL
jgi:hypothetical protein